MWEIQQITATLKILREINLRESFHETVEKREIHSHPNFFP